MRNRKYNGISDDEIMCDKCGGHTDMGLECNDCGNDMWNKVYPEDFINKYGPSYNSDVETHMRYSFMNGEERDYYANHEVVAVKGDIHEMVNVDQSATFYGKYYSEKPSGEMSFNLHNDEGPALITQDSVFFFLNGRQVLLEDLPCDEVSKTYLKLKYGCPDEQRRYYPVYTNTHE